MLGIFLRAGSLHRLSSSRLRSFLQLYSEFNSWESFVSLAWALQSLLDTGAGISNGTHYKMGGVVSPKTNVYEGAMLVKGIIRHKEQQTQEMPTISR